VRGNERSVLRLAIFACLSLVLAYVSRASLRTPRSHGFPRFFAWECILALFCINFIDVRQWFGDPLSPRQMVSWVFLFGGIIPAVLGVHLLRTRGKPDAGRAHDAALAWIETTTRLVTTGVYRYIRHPLYSSLLLLAWGVFFKRPSWLGGALAFGATGFLVATAKVEEAENVRYFGAAYGDYMRRTRMFIPFVF